MAEDRYVICAGKHGNVEIAANVIMTIAGIAALDTEGVSAIGNSITSENIGKQSEKALAKAIRIEILENAASIDIALNLDFGAEIPKVVPNVQEKVKNAVENMTGLTIADVNIKIIGIGAEK
jgi:uncharacterized alkaline shock family protein YloU